MYITPDSSDERWTGDSSLTRCCGFFGAYLPSFVLAVSCPDSFYATEGALGPLRPRLFFPRPVPDVFLFL